MDLETIIINEESKRKTNIGGVTYMWNQQLVMQMNSFVKQKQTHRLQNKTHITKEENALGQGC